MSDPGLTVFACHRLVPRLDGFGAEDFLALAKPYFDVREVELEGDLDTAKARLTEALAQADAKSNSLGLVSHDTDKAYLLTLKPGANGRADRFGTWKALWPSWTWWCSPTWCWTRSWL